jgi:hypothetical protein
MEPLRVPGRWRVLVPPADSRRRPDPPRPSGKWQRGWRSLAEELAAEAAAEGRSAPAAERRPLATVPRRHRADVAGRYSAEERVEYEQIKAELEWREQARRRERLVRGDDQAVVVAAAVEPRSD